jgi:hypothetical protein
MDPKAAPSNELDRGGLGPQVPNEHRLIARMRFHQSWYRSQVLQVPFGTGPTEQSRRWIGSMLSRDAAEAGLNFLSEHTLEVAKQRLAAGGGAERFRLLHNLLSSQPMCFNLFAPLQADEELAMDVCRDLLGCPVSRVLAVRLEWAPAPSADYLDDKTSFDCFIEYEALGGRVGFLAVETKLTDSFSPKRHDGSAYRRWMTPESPWPNPACSQVAKSAHNQLWRNHLLAWSMLQNSRGKYREGHIVVVHHPLDIKCGRIVDGYRALLRDGSNVHALPLDVLLGHCEHAAGSQQWIQQFRLRYLELDRSERDWQRYLLGARARTTLPPSP